MYVLLCDFNHKLVQTGAEKADYTFM